MSGTRLPLRDGFTDAMGAVVAAYGLPTVTCDVCRGGEWIEDGVTVVGVHHGDCPRGESREALGA